MPFCFMRPRESLHGSGSKATAACTPPNPLPIEEGVLPRIASAETCTQCGRAGHLQCSLLEHLPAGVILTSDPEQNILYQNRRFIEMFGYTIVQCPTFKDFCHLAYPDPEYRKWASSEWERRIATAAIGKRMEIDPMEAGITTKDGSVRFVRIHMTLLDGVNFITFFDLTNRRKTKEALLKKTQELDRVKAITAALNQANLGLREVTERLTLATQAADMGVWDLDFSNSLVTWDDQMFQIYGLPKMIPMPHENWKKTVHKDDFAKVWASLSRTVENKAYDTVEFRIFRPDGQLRWIAEAQCVVLDDQGEVVRLVGTSTDITERKLSQIKLSASERHFRAFFERPLVGMATMSPERSWLEVNDQLCRMLGYSREELQLQTWDDTTFPVDQARNQAKLNLILAGKIDDYIIEIRCLRKDKSILYAQTSVSCLRKEDGLVDYLVVLVVDVTGQHQAQEQLRKAAYHDALTQLPNRRLLLDRLQQAMAKARREKCALAVCYLDLDGFKSVNDKLGHASGDQLLIQVANRLKSCIREGDTVARLGGDEFVILLNKVADVDECRQILERLLKSVAANYIIANTEQSDISISIGVTLFPSDLVDPEILLRHADHAMFAAKHSGKNRFVFFDGLAV